ncbi:MAG: Uma2 family endonuclease [Acidimicrobiales bacterium]
MSAIANHPDRPFELEDLLDAPDDGYRYEIIDGALVLNPAPAWRHQRIIKNLLLVLSGAAPPEIEVLPAPVWHIGPGQIPEPDIVVVERSKLGDIAVEGTPLLVVEVLSPSNRGSDLVRKRALYAEAGCPHYWIVDPTGPTVTVLTLIGGTYSETASVAGQEHLRVEVPFPISLHPGIL